MFGTLLIGCAFMGSLVDALFADKAAGATEAQARATAAQSSLPPDVKRRVMGAITIVYVRSHVGEASRRDQILLSCNNPEVIRGNQHSRQRRER